MYSFPSYPEIVFTKFSSNILFLLCSNYIYIRRNFCLFYGTNFTANNQQQLHLFQFRIILNNTISFIIPNSWQSRCSEQLHDRASGSVAYRVPGASRVPVARRPRPRYQSLANTRTSNNAVWDSTSPYR